MKFKIEHKHEFDKLTFYYSTIKDEKLFFASKRKYEVGETAAVRDYLILKVTRVHGDNNSHPYFRS